MFDGSAPVRDRDSSAYACLSVRRCTAVADESAPTGAVLHRCGNSSAVVGVQVAPGSVRLFAQRTSGQPEAPQRRWGCSVRAFSTPLAFRCRGANRCMKPRDPVFHLFDVKQKQRAISCLMEAHLCATAVRSKRQIPQDHRRIRVADRSAPTCGRGISRRAAVEPTSSQQLTRISHTGRG
jgi:hypothetical protein